MNTESCIAKNTVSEVTSLRDTYDRLLGVKLNIEALYAKSQSMVDKFNNTDAQVKGSTPDGNCVTENIVKTFNRVIEDMANELIRINDNIEYITNHIG